MTAITDFLFYLLGGVPIMYTFWILPWIMVWVCAMTGTVVLPIFQRWNQIWVMPVFIVFFFGGMIMALSVPLAQLNLISECRMFETEVVSELSEPTTITLRECRRKSTVYEEFGPWTISQ
jgi:hypothetical protein|tara:strand:+ start:1499 stop:1858 length:360 start_codon:yes stop_codon:yes gene_type:complete